MKLGLELAIATIFVLIWSTGFVIARLAMPYVEPATFLFWRCIGVLAAMAALSLFWRITWPSWSQTKHIAVAGSLLQFGYLLGVYFAIHLGMGAGLAAIIVGLQPILTAWFAAWVSEQVTPRQWIGLGFGFAGVALVVLEKITFVHIPFLLERFIRKNIVRYLIYGQAPQFNSVFQQFFALFSCISLRQVRWFGMHQ